MTTSPVSSSTPSDATPTDRVPLRLELRGSAVPGQPDGVWWPQSRDLQVEGADLIDHFPAGRINRMVFSRPDWDESVVEGRGEDPPYAARGPVKVGSFPSDDTHEMILAMANGQRLHLTVVAPDASEADAKQAMDGATAGS